MGVEFARRAGDLPPAPQTLSAASGLTAPPPRRQPQWNLQGARLRCRSPPPSRTSFKTLRPGVATSIKTRSSCTTSSARLDMSPTASLLSAATRSRRRSAEPASSASSAAPRARARARSGCARTWTRCRSRRRPTSPIAPKIRAKCTPAATTGIRRCCSARRGAWLKPATSPAMPSSSSSPPKRAARARGR